ncbi:MAG: helix-turn-helix domain-containing protein [Candidatus Omnitrophota bacterium]
MEIHEHEVYTPKETQALLKVSSSTMTRMIKSGLIRAAKVGKQYRILGKEILRVISPKLEDRVGKAYNKARHWVHEGIDEPARRGAPKGAVKK